MWEKILKLESQPRGGSNIQIRMVSERKNWENCSEEIVQENSAGLKGTHFQMETVKST